MVWPEDTIYKESGDKGPVEVKTPRARFYAHGVGIFTAFISSRKGDAIPIVKLGKIIYEKYKDIEIFYSTKKKIRITSSNMETINSIIVDEALRCGYSVYIPSELCEVKGVCPLPAEYTEREIYEHAYAKNIMKFGPLPEYCKVTEVFRFTRFESEKSRKRVDIDSVRICFSGNVLPSHISMDGVSYPVLPYREPVIQCRKCWRFGHTDRVCSRSVGICCGCGGNHTPDSGCSCALKCVNCEGAHGSDSKLCPAYLTQVKIKADKASLLKPSLSSRAIPTPTKSAPLFNMSEFPSLSSRPVKSAVPAKRARLEEPEPNITSPNFSCKSTEVVRRPTKERKISESSNEACVEERVISRIEKIFIKNIRSSDSGTIQYIKPFFSSIVKDFKNTPNGAQDRLCTFFGSIIGQFESNDENSST